MWGLACDAAAAVIESATTTWKVNTAAAHPATNMACPGLTIGLVAVKAFDRYIYFHKIYMANMPGCERNQHLAEPAQDVLNNFVASLRCR